MSNYIGVMPTSSALADPASLVIVSASTVLSVQTYGKTLICTGAGGYTLTLPGLTAGGYAGIITVVNDSSSSVTVSATDPMRLAGASNSTVSISKGEAATFQNETSVWNVVSTSVKASLSSPALTGTPTTVSPASNDSSQQIPNTSWVSNFIANLGLAPKASPTFTGTPIVPTISSGTDTSQQIANAAFVQAAITAGVTVTTGSGYTLYRFPNTRVQILVGQFVNTNTTSAGSSVTFPVAFPNGAYMFSNDYMGGANSTAINWVSSTTFQAWGKQTSSNTYSSTTTTYFAIGTY